VYAQSNLGLRSVLERDVRDFLRRIRVALAATKRPPRFNVEFSPLLSPRAAEGFAALCGAQ
jgi:hypothetical protein